MSIIKRRNCLFLCLLAASSLAIAESTDWLEGLVQLSNPNELPIFIGIDDDCTLNKSSAESITKGVLVRSRIKPLGDDHWILREFYLKAAITCLKSSNGTQIFSLNVHFGKVTNNGFFLFDRDFGIFGRGDEESIEDALKESVERAITFYLKANFELGE